MTKFLKKLVRVWDPDFTKATTKEKIQMYVAEKEISNGVYFAEKDVWNELIDLEQYAQDGRLTEPSDGKAYDYRKMLERVELLGRPLTDEEAEEYRI